MEQKIQGENIGGSERRKHHVNFEPHEMKYVGFEPQKVKGVSCVSWCFIDQISFGNFFLLREILFTVHIGDLIKNFEIFYNIYYGYEY